MFTAVRKHEIHCGHRVYQHEGKCKNLHGHSYVFEFHCESQSLDQIGRVIDFSVIKSKLCQWLEDYWDHRTLLWDKDPLCLYIYDADQSIVKVPFNPTAENIAEYMLKVVAPAQLTDTSVLCRKVVVHETGKCFASCEIPNVK